MLRNFQAITGDIATAGRMERQKPYKETVYIVSAKSKGNM